MGSCGMLVVGGRLFASLYQASSFVVEGAVRGEGEGDCWRWRREWELLRSGGWRLEFSENWMYASSSPDPEVKVEEVVLRAPGQYSRPTFMNSSLSWLVSTDDDEKKRVSTGWIHWGVEVSAITVEVILGPSVVEEEEEASLTHDIAIVCRGAPFLPPPRAESTVTWLPPNLCFCNTTTVSS